MACDKDSNIEQQINFFRCSLARDGDANAVTDESDILCNSVL
jgi:hypothetical protein